jgi:hypothetical protein
MSFTFVFETPYEITSAEVRLNRAQQQAATNISAESDLSGFSGSERVYEGNQVTWTLIGVDAVDLSQETRDEIISAIQSELPGAAEFEVVSES